MRILLSAFACDPRQGSEEGVGWTWAYHLARYGHDVCVLTRDYHRSAIEGRLGELGMPNLTFEYIGVRYVPLWIPGLGVYPYYIIWQWNAYFRAKRKHRECSYDIVHHISYGVFRNASYLYLLDIPFIFGPVGGGERSPRALRAGMSRGGRISEAVRDFANLIPYIDPLWHGMLRRCARIVVRTKETLACLPKKARERTVVALENMVSQEPHLAGESNRGVPFKLLFAGRLIALKGIPLALKAMSLANDRIAASLTIVGKGPEEDRLKKEVRNLGLEECVEFIPWLPQPKMFEMYAAHDAVLFPSLHDSGGTVVMEAIARGRPVICLDLGGPAETVDRHCAKIVNTRGRTEEEVVRGIASAIVELAGMTQGDWEEMRRAAVRRAQYFSPERVIERVYGPLVNAKE